MTDVAASTLRLADPDTFADGVPHDAIAELRRREPVSWQEMDGEPGFWAVLTHAGVQAASQDPVTFSSHRQGVMLEDPDPESLELSRDMLLVMDPPRHGSYRQPVSPSFKRSVVARLEEQVRTICREIMAEAGERGPEVELVHQVSALLPSRVIGTMMGIPEVDWARIHLWSEQMLTGQDPDVGADAGDAGHGAMVEMVGYAMAFAADRRAGPLRGDVTDVLLGSDFDGRRMTDLDFASFFAQLVAAGNDTTKTLTASGVVALLDHPDQMALVREHPRLRKGAVEEMLRWANPVHYMRRTATRDTVLEGVEIPAGDKVALYYTAANRDDAVFVDPDTFDVTRDPNRHLSFGIAEHFCLGAHLARLEALVFFDELFEAFDRIEPAGRPVRLRSNLVNGYRSVPVRLG
jgi:cytochrome P450